MIRAQTLVRPMHTPWSPMGMGSARRLAYGQALRLVSIAAAMMGAALGIALLGFLMAARCTGF